MPVRSWLPFVLFDLNADKRISREDRRIWLEDLKHTRYGGANLDGEFKSSDMVTAFVVGGYEQGPRTDPVAVAVSELGAWLLLSLAIAAILTVRRCVAHA